MKLKKILAALILISMLPVSVFSASGQAALPKAETQNAEQAFPSLKMSALRAVAVQVPTSGKTSLRFCAVTDTLDLEEVGFMITASYEGKTDTQTQYTTTVYESILSGGETVKASDLGGAYVFAATVNGLPEDVAVKFRFCAVGKKDGKIYASEAKEYTMNDYNESAVLTELKTLAGKPSLEAVDCGDGCKQLTVTGKGASYFSTYCGKLTESGYTLRASKTIDNNQFATFTGNGAIVTVYYVGLFAELRVITESALDRVLPSFVPESVEKIYSSTLLTQVGTQWYEGQDQCGMCYVFRLKDGSFIVIDGNYGDSVGDDLFHVLEKQAEGGEIRIAAWIVTHGHVDHYQGADKLLETYGDRVTVEKFIYHFPSEPQAAIENCLSYQKDVLASMASRKEAKKVIVHAGEEFYIRDVKFTMLFAMDVFEPKALTNYNVSSLFFYVEADGQKILFPGDHTVDRGAGNTIGDYNIVTDMYSDATLQSDFVQVVHHGLGGGADYGFYERVNASYVLWPCGIARITSGNTLGAQPRNAYFWKEGHGQTFVSDDNVDVFTLGETVTVEHFDSFDEYIHAGEADKLTRYSGEGRGVVSKWSDFSLS